MKEVQIQLNGEQRNVPEGMTIAALLEDLGISTGKVAVERNRTIEARSGFGQAELQAGDQLEIVRFVGGG
ncbi:sulfur carrier protein ThiS [Parvularcula maris]|uniref:Sulfur carrier protein ThiS n=1 Tax=Parvularcula maris TaxID=2965077 RepID=A0A9X2L8N4_9PROT|nr:sulfur carrier protein ThiS [Parvularcula maris]